MSSGYANRLRESLESYYARHAREQVTVDLPFDEILTSEGDGVDGEPGEYEMAQRRAAVRAVFRYVGKEGPNPLKAMKRFYTLARGMGIEPFCNLTMEEAGLMLGETKAAVSYRMKQLSGKVEVLGMKGSRLPGQKVKSSSPNYSKAQAGNSNRRKKGG